jgi:hypothetical protein
MAFHRDKYNILSVTRNKIPIKGNTGESLEKA